MRVTFLSALLLAAAISQSALSAEPRLTQEEATRLALSALKAKYPDEYPYYAKKFGPFHAEFRGGVWHVYTYGPAGELMAGGGGPAIEVRDRDPKVLKIYFSR
jgi:hypothetical protein